jgi:ADP-ribose pyrophosphatase YjhB (NUDIX family)
MIKKFKFCPNCKNKLEHLSSHLINCPSCHFHFYLNPVPTTAIILENNKGEILLVKRKISPKKGFWDLPGGFIEFNEKAEEAILRELKEELNLTFLPSIKFLGSFIGRYFYKGITYQPLCLVFFAKIDDFVRIEVADDVSSFSFFKKEKIPWPSLAFPDIKEALKEYLKNF